MKVRLGFVSNSSSSSFVAIVPEHRFESYMKSLDPWEKAVINFKNAKIDGQNFMIWTDNVSSECFDEDYQYSKRALEIADEDGVDLKYSIEDDEYGDLFRARAWYALHSACRKVKKFGGWTEDIGC